MKEQDYIKKIDAFTRRPDMSLLEYVEKKERMMANLVPNMEVGRKVEHIVDGLRPKETFIDASRVLHNLPEGKDKLEALREWATQAQSIDRRAETLMGMEVVAAIDTKKERLICRACHKEGHYAKDCTLEKCKKCGFTNHTTDECKAVHCDSCRAYHVPGRHLGTAVYKSNDCLQSANGGSLRIKGAENRN
eukprot:TRINITY_DN181_c0_g1_i6.p1 TRINITY_DN181_c0_g1~~TRINITY_DN181_c0_g1_i6.p1  ORF type:complete len:191 (+),score=8.15 TRINITY_DN181_c0_g1_i6:769-1341(+)